MYVDRHVKCHNAPHRYLSMSWDGSYPSPRMHSLEAPRRRQYRPWILHHNMLLLLLLMTLLSPARAVKVAFENCLDKSILDSDPPQLQFVPLDVTVIFDVNDTLHPLNITVYGNVSGTADRTPAPAPGDPNWSNPNSSVGKIVDLDVANNKYSTAQTNIEMLTFTSYNQAFRFCETLKRGSCPLGPLFDVNT